MNLEKVLKRGKITRKDLARLPVTKCRIVGIKTNQVFLDAEIRDLRWVEPDRMNRTLNQKETGKMGIIAVIVVVFFGVLWSCWDGETSCDY